MAAGNHVDWRRIVYGLILVALFAGVVGFAGTATAQETVNNCTVIDTPGEYELESDLQNSTTCIEINSSDVNFDGMGYNVSGSDAASAEYGIYVNGTDGGVTNVTVRNVTVQGWNATGGVGIRYNSVADGEVSDTVVRENTEGVELYNASGNAILDNTIIDNLDNGTVAVTGSDNNTFDGNEITANGAAGVVVDTPDVTLVHNNVSLNTERGLVAGGPRVNATNNTITGNGGDGIWLDGGENVIVADNAIADNGGDGLLLLTPDFDGTVLGNTTIVQNTITGHARNVNVTNDGSADSTLTNVTFRDNTFDTGSGNESLYVELSSSANTTVEALTVENNTVTGGGLLTLDLSSGSVVDLAVRENQFDGDDLGITVSMSNGPTLQNVTIVDNNLTTSNFNGISVVPSSTSSGTITGLTVDNNTLDSSVDIQADDQETIDGITITDNSLDQGTLGIQTRENGSITDVNVQNNYLNTSGDVYFGPAGTTANSNALMENVSIVNNTFDQYVNFDFWSQTGGSGNGTLQNVTVRSNDFRATDWGLRFLADEGDEIVDVSVVNNTFVGDPGYVDGVLFDDGGSPRGTFENVSFRDNQITGFEDSGFDFTTGSLLDIEVMNNTIADYDNDNDNDNDGLLVRSSVDATNLTITKNNITSSGGSDGISLDLFTAGENTENVEISDNEIDVDSDGLFVEVGNEPGNLTDLLLENNTVVAGYSYVGSYNNASIVNATITKNEFKVPDGHTTNWWGLDLYAQSSTNAKPQFDGLSITDNKFHMVPNDELLIEIIGIEVTGDGDSSVRNVAMVGNNLTDGDVGITVNGGGTGFGLEESFEITDNGIINMSAHGIEVADPFAGERLAIDANTIETDNGRGISLGATGGINVTDNTVVASVKDGVLLSDTKDVVVSSNNVTNNDRSGIWLDKSSNVDVLDNLFSDNELAGIWIKDSDNATVSGNQISNTTISGFNEPIPYDGSGIVLTGGATHNLTNNSVNESELTGIYLYEDVTDSTLDDNVVRNSGAWSLTINGTGYGSPSGNVVDGLDIGSSTAANTTLSFEGRNVSVGPAADPGENPDRTGIGRYLAATNVTNDTFLDVALAYEDGDLGSVVESTLELWRYDGSWTAVDSTVNTAANNVTANVTDFSTFGAFGNEQAQFTVDITDTNEPVTEGGSLDVEATIENVGGVQATQTIELRDFSGSVVDTTSLTLADGGSETVTLTWATDDGDAGSGDVSVDSDDDTDATAVTIEASSDDSTGDTGDDTTDETEEPTEPAFFDVGITDTSEQVVEGGDLDVEATVENTGDEETTQTVSLTNFGGETVDSESVTLAGGESETVTLTWSTGDGDAGSGDVTVSSDDDAESMEVIILEATKVAFYQVAIDQAPESVEAGDEVSVRYTVENTGGEATTQEITVSVDGTVDQTEADVSLDPGETVQFTYTTVSDANDVPQIVVDVSSDDSTDTAVVSVSDDTDSEEEADEEEESDEKGETEADETDGDDAESEEAETEADRDENGPGFGIVTALLATLALLGLSGRN